MTRKRRPKTYLTAAQKEEVIKLAKDPKITYRKIAKTYNIAESHVSRLALRAGIVRIRKNLKRVSINQSEDTKPVKAALNFDIPLIEQLQTLYDDISEELTKWEQLKHEACHKIDTLRRARQEHYIALQALKRAKENNS